VNHMNPLKVLFLDIDGVLASVKSCIALGGWPRGVEPKDLPLFDPVALGLLRSLCETAGVSIVISSTWRLMHGWDRIGRGLDLPTMGATPRLCGIRGDEIAAWMLDYPGVIESYAILDDDSDMLSDQMANFVKVSGTDGLSYENFKDLCTIFRVNPYDCAPRWPDGSPRRVLPAGGVSRIESSEQQP
jgi:hypothetical protein